MRRFISVGILVLASLSPAAALADEPPADAPPSTTPSATPPTDAEPPERTQEEALATELFTAARELMASGRHAEACPKLIESARLSKKVGTFGKLAECHEKTGRLVAARADLQQAANLARAMSDERLSIVEQELSRIDAIVPKLVLSMSDPPPAELEVAIDGVKIGIGLLGTPIPFDPGRHEVVVTAPGKQPWRSAIELSADGRNTPLLVPPPRDAAPPTAKQPPGPPAGRSPLAIGGIVAAGAGAAAVGVGAFFGGLAVARADESKRPGACNDEDVCSTAAAEIRNGARAAGDVSTALLVAGGALLAGGLTLWLVGTEPRPAPPRPRVGLQVSLGTLSIEGRF